MGTPRDPYLNRGPIEYTSLPSAVTFGPPITWIQIVAAGSGGLVVKTEDGQAHTYTGLAAGDTYYGPFNELTSMTCGKIRVGDGQAPSINGSAAPSVPSASLAPCVAIAVANQATLSGLAQTIDGVALSTAGMRVYLAKQTTGTQNGMWLAQSGNWTRPADWASAASIPIGTQIQIAPGGTANFQAFGSTWYTDSGAVVDTDTIVAYPKINKGLATLSSASPSTVTVSNLWIKGTIASGASSLATSNATTAANGVKGVLTAGAGSGTLVLTGPNTVTDVVSYIIANG